MIIIGSAKTPAEHHAASRKAKKRVAKIGTADGAAWADVTCAAVNRDLGRFARTGDVDAINDAYLGALALLGVCEALLERQG